jgi:hypothetical protein
MNFYDHHFYEKRIKNDRVEHELAYAKTGSDVPSSLHGVFWMDMFYQSSIAKDPTYQNKPSWIKDLQHILPNIAPAMVAPDLETLVCFGDKPAMWDPETRTLKNAGYCGDKGHWTFPNTIMGKVQASQVIDVRMNADLVFENEGMTEVYIAPSVRDPVVGMWVQAPKAAFAMKMFKTEWGWNRKTSVAIMPDEWNYPMVQIVDGDGKRTKYYDEYLEFMKRWGSDEQIVIARGEGSGYCDPFCCCCPSTGCC